jgi:serine/threonine-protein kinase HipA
LGIGAHGRSATLDNALTSFARFGLDIERAREIIDRLWLVVREWKVYFESCGVPAIEIAKIAPAFRHIDDILQKR